MDACALVQMSVYWATLNDRGCAVFLSPRSVSFLWVKWKCTVLHVALRRVCFHRAARRRFAAFIGVHAVRLKLTQTEREKWALSRLGLTNRKVDEPEAVMVPPARVCTYPRVSECVWYWVSVRVYLHHASLKVGNREEGSAPDISPQASHWSGPQFMEIALMPTNCWGPPERDRGPRFPSLLSLPLSSFCCSEKLSRGAGTCNWERAEAAGDEGERWGGLNLCKMGWCGRGGARKRERRKKRHAGRGWCHQKDHKQRLKK